MLALRFLARGVQKAGGAHCCRSWMPPAPPPPPPTNTHTHAHPASEEQAGAGAVPRGLRPAEGRQGRHRRPASGAGAQPRPAAARIPGVVCGHGGGGRGEAQPDVREGGVVQAGGAVPAGVQAYQQEEYTEESWVIPAGAEGEAGPAAAAATAVAATNAQSRQKDAAQVLRGRAPQQQEQQQAAGAGGGPSAEVLDAARPLLTGNPQADRDIIKFYQARAALLRGMPSLV